MAAAVYVAGLPQFLAALREAEGGWESALSLAHQRIASQAAEWSRQTARGMGGVQAKAASAIGAKHTAKSAAVAVFPSWGDRMAPVAFWGAKKHTGWYSAARYRNSVAQHPTWVGSSWEVAGSGGPYAINATLRTRIDELLDEYFKSIETLARSAFPER